MDTFLLGSAPSSITKMYENNNNNNDMKDAIITQRTVHMGDLNML